MEYPLEHSMCLRGSVVVTAGGRILVEGVDYSVNYQLGKFKF
jgi:cell surface protein SprA